MVSEAGGEIRSTVHKRKKRVVIMEFKRQWEWFERMINVICPTHLLLKVPEAPLAVSEKTGNGKAVVELSTA